MARVRVSDNGVEFDVYLDDKLRVRIGRADECELRIEDPQASRVHAQLTLTESGFLLQDHGSANGTSVNGRPVKRHPLRDGDTIAIGAARMVFRDPDQATRLQHAAASGALPVPAEPAPMAVEPRPAPGSGRHRAAAGRPRTSGRVAARRRGGLDGAVIGGGVLLVGLVVAVVVLTGGRRGGGAAAAARPTRGGGAPGAAAGDMRGTVALPGLAPVSAAAAGGSSAADAATQALRDADARAIPAASGGRFGEAVAAYDAVMARHPDTPAAAQAATRRQRVLDDAATLWASRHERAHALARDRQFDAARAIYQQIIDGWGLPEYVKRAQDRLSYVDDLATH
jgi:predicted component of type VI protein secretion system